MKIKPCILMGQYGARCMHVKHSKSAAGRVPTVSYKRGQEPISDCTNCPKCLRSPIKNSYHNVKGNYNFESETVESLNSSTLTF